MKKSLITMALMFGAVVFVMSSCGGKDDKKTCKTCTITLDAASTPAKAYTSGEKCDADLTATEALNGKAVEGDDATTENKGDKYKVVCN
jgi:hypothetical protein